LIGGLFGHDFRVAGPVLKVLTFGWFFHVLYIPLQYTFYALDKAKVRFVLEFVKCGVAVTCILFAVPRFGAIGAAYSISLAMVMNFFISGLIAVKLIRKNCDESALDLAVAGREV